MHNRSLDKRNNIFKFITNISLLDIWDQMHIL